MQDEARPNQPLVKWVMRRFKFHLWQFDATTRSKLEIGDIDRACGDVVCDKCGLKYHDHPGIHNYDGLVVTCDWRVYKL